MEVVNETPQAEETSAPTTETEGSESTPEAGGESAAPAFTPNFDLTVNDQKFQIPEKFRALITDEMTQKEVREVFEKAYGLDYAKPRHEKLRTDFDDYKGKTEPLLKSWGKLSKMYQEGDLENFFKGLQIPDNILAKYVLGRLNYNELTPEQKAAYDRQVSQREQTYMASEQAAHYQGEFEKMAVATRTLQLDTLLERPSIAQMREVYDGKIGAGKFRDAVVDYGFEVWKTTGKDIPVEEAVQGVWSRIAPFAQTPTVQPGQAPNGLIRPNTQGKPVLPNIAGRGTSPAKTKVKTVEDIRNRYREMSSS